jgi:hypothetical protein
MGLAVRLAGQLFAALLVVLLAIAGAANSLQASSGFLREEVALETAAAARAVSDGEGYHARVIYPVTTSLYRDSVAQPYFREGPFFPLLLAAYLPVKGDNDLTVRLCSVLGFVLCVIAAILLGARMAGFLVGIVSGIAVAVNPAAALVGAQGTGHAWAAAFFTLALVCVGWRTNANGTAAPAAKRPWRPVVELALAGLCMGLCYLSLLYTLPLVLVLYWFASKREDGIALPRRRLAFWLPFLLCAVPWWIFCLVETRAPFYSFDRYATFYNYATLYPGHAILQEMRDPGSPLLFLGSTPKQLVSLIVASIGEGYSAIPALLGGVLLPLVVAGFFNRPGSGGERALRSMAWIALVALMVWTVNIRLYGETHLALLPAFSVLGVALIHRLLSAQRRWIAIAAWTIVAILAICPMATWRLGATPPRIPAFGAPLAEARERLPKNLVLVTDVPSQVAWYGARVAISLPRGERNLGQILRSVGNRPVGYFVTSALLAPGPKADLKIYQDMLTSEAPPEGFVEVKLQTPVRARLFVPAALADQIAPPPAPPTDQPAQGDGS